MNGRHITLIGMVLCILLGQAVAEPVKPVDRTKEIHKINTQLRSAKAYQKRYEGMLKKAEAQYAYVRSKGYLREIPIKRKKVADTKVLLEKQNAKVSELEQKMAYLTSTTLMVEDTLLSALPRELQPPPGSDWNDLTAGRAMEWINKHIANDLKGKVVQYTLKCNGVSQEGKRAKLSITESHAFRWGPTRFARLQLAAVFKADQTDKVAKIPNGAKMVVTGPVSAMTITPGTEEEPAALSVTLDPCDCKYSVFMQK